MRRLIAACVLVALVFATGCTDVKKVKDLETQVAQQQAKITELEGQVQTLTAARDSLAKLVADMSAKTPAGKKATTPPPGGEKPKPPAPSTGKPPRTGR